MGMTSWVTVSQASDILGMSERSIRRHIAEGKLESKLDGGRRLVMVDIGYDNDDNNDSDVMTATTQDELVNWLKNELEKREKQILQLQEEMKIERQRSDEIIMKLASELEAQRSLLEGSQPKRDENLWSKFRKNNAD
jgi:hypothetical protein